MQGGMLTERGTDAISSIPERKEGKRSGLLAKGFISSTAALALLMGYFEYTPQEKKAEPVNQDPLYYNQLYAMFRSDTNEVKATIKAVPFSDKGAVEYLNLVNGATSHIWYQWGVSYLAEKHNFSLAYNVWKDNTKILSSNEDASELSFSRGGIKAGDTISLSLKITLNTVKMEAQDLRTGETVMKVFPSLEHVFRGGTAGSGTFTGIMSEEISKIPMLTQPHQEYFLPEGSSSKMEMERISLRLVPIKINDNGKIVSGYRITPLINSGMNDEYLFGNEFVTGSR